MLTYVGVAYNRYFKIAAPSLNRIYKSCRRQPLQICYRLKHAQKLAGNLLIGSGRVYQASPSDGRYTETRDIHLWYGISFSYRLHRHNRQSTVLRCNLRAYSPGSVDHKDETRFNPCP